MADEPVTFIVDGMVVSNDPRFESYPVGEKPGEDNSEGEAEKSLEDMTGEELKAKVAELKDQGVEVDTKGVKTKSDLVAAIQAATAPAE